MARFRKAARITRDQAVGSGAHTAQADTKRAKMSCFGAVL